MVRQREAAEDVTQKTFVALARSANKLAARPVLSSWLHITARNLAAESARSDIRRRNREQGAIVMRDAEDADSESIWTGVAKHLDDALARLGDNDRDALSLRYFEGKSTREIAGLLGTSEEAIQRRINRAVHRLRAQLFRKGIPTTAATLGLCLSSKAVEAAPAGLAPAISKAALIAPPSSAVWPAILTLLMTTTQKKIAVALVMTLCAGAAVRFLSRSSAPVPTERQAAAAAVELPLDQYTGDFRMDGHELILTKRGRGLAIGSRNGGAPFVAYPQSATEFVSHDQGSLTTLSFTLDNAGRAAGFRLMRDGRLLGELKRGD